MEKVSQAVCAAAELDAMRAAKKAGAGGGAAAAVPLPALLPVGGGGGGAPVPLPDANFDADIIAWDNLVPTGIQKGKGGQAIVNVFSYRGMEVAVKELPNLTGSSEKERAQFWEEIRVHRFLEHDHVCRLYGVAQGKGCVCALSFSPPANLSYLPFSTPISLSRHLGLVMKLYDCSLAEKIVSPGGVAPVDAILYIQQMAAAIAYVHSQSAVVGDIKPQNVLLAVGHKEVVIADFGYASFKAASKSVMSKGTYLGCGTPQFMAPELFLDDENGDPTLGPSFAADVYAFGCTVWCLISGKALPYPLEDEKGKRINERVRVPKGLRPGTALTEPFVYDEANSGISQAFIDAMKASSYPELLDIIRECL